MNWMLPGRAELVELTDVAFCAAPGSEASEDWLEEEELMEATALGAWGPREAERSSTCFLARIKRWCNTMEPIYMPYNACIVALYAVIR